MESLWRRDTAIPRREPLPGDTETDALVIGAGLCGIMTAYMLKERGVRCIVIDSGLIAGGATENTTAKISAQHGPIYAKLKKSFGDVAAGQYLRANLAAKDKFFEISERESIDCDLTSAPSYLYAVESPRALEEEHAALLSLGAESELLAETELPFKAACALKLPSQAHFHPLKFIAGISKNLEIYEKTRALAYSDGIVTTNRGRISAKNFVLASHFPFINTPGYYFLRMHKERSYAAALSGAQELSGMYLGIDSGSFSFRPSGSVLIIGGGGHRCGEFTAGAGMAALKKLKDELYPDASELCRWSTEDCMTHDGVPYIGKFSKDTPNLYVATGFNKWGMTTSLAAAELLSRAVAGEEEAFGIFDPGRANFAPSLRGLVSDAGYAVRGLAKRAFSVPDISDKDLKPGEGALIERGGYAYGAYRTEDGRIFIVSAQCPHLGCRLSWNPDELTWDCPCHGSRFGYDGSVIGSPANEGLECTVISI